MTLLYNANFRPISVHISISVLCSFRNLLECKVVSESFTSAPTQKQKLNSSNSSNAFRKLSDQKLPILCWKNVHALHL